MQLHQMPDFPDLVAMNDWLEQCQIDLCRETAHGTLSGSIAPQGTSVGRCCAPDGGNAQADRVLGGLKR